MSGLTHYTLTLDGTAQNVATVLSLSGEGPYQQITIYADDGNGAPVYVGSAGVSSSDYGVALDAEESFNIGPLGLSAQVRLRDIYVTGTSTQKVHFLVIPH